MTSIHPNRRRPALLPMATRSSPPIRHWRSVLFGVLLCCLPTSWAHAYDRVNVLVRHIPVFGPNVHGVPGPPNRYKRNSVETFSSPAVLGDSLLFTDSASNRVLRLRHGVISVFAGNGQAEGPLDPNSPTNSALNAPSSLLVLRDGSVLIARDPPAAMVGVDVVRIRTRPRQGEAIVSRFAGNGGLQGAIAPHSALDTEIAWVGGMAEERDGSVLVSDPRNNRVLRVHPNATVEVVAGTGIRGDHIDPAQGPRTQLFNPNGLAVLEDDSVLVADTGNHRVLRVRPDSVTIFAGTAPEAEHPVPFDRPVALTVLPDQSVWLLECHLHEPSDRLLRITGAEVGMLAGPADGAIAADPDHGYPGLRIETLPSSNMWTALRDGSVVIGSTSRGMLLLSPADALQALLEDLVHRGKAAVRIQNLAEYRRVELDLAYLSAPGQRALSAVNRAAYQQPSRLEPPDLQPRLHLIGDLVRIVRGYADSNGAERLRAQLALRELRKFKMERLGRGY